MTFGLLVLMPSMVAVSSARDILEGIWVVFRHQNANPFVARECKSCEIEPTLVDAGLQRDSKEELCIDGLREPKL